MEISTVYVNDALRTVGTSHPPISLSAGFVSSHPIELLPPYKVPYRVPDKELVYYAIIALDATSLPVTLALVSSLGVRGHQVSFLPGDTHTLYPAGSSNLSGAASIQVSSIDIARSTWTFHDRVKFKAFFFGSRNTGGDRLNVRTVRDRFARPIFATINNDTSLNVANMELDASPLIITRYDVIEQPLPVFGSIMMSGHCYMGNATVSAETAVDYIAPIANSFVADAQQVERNALIETSLRVLGDLADNIERALEGSGRVSTQVNQATFVENHQGYLRALAAAMTSDVRPLVDASYTSNHEAFPYLDTVDYINLPANAVRIKAPIINLYHPYQIST